MNTPAPVPVITTPVVHIYSPVRSPLFTAALQLLANEPDPLARLCLLRDAFPKAQLSAIMLALRETAILLKYAGIQPAGGGQ